MAFLPNKADSVLLIDPDAELPGPVPFQPFKTVSRRDLQFRDVLNAIELVELAPRNRPNGLRTALSSHTRPDAVKNVLGRNVSE